ncbi:hypothetical protein HDU76_005055 [Blyttiomyces sp. JEL0837]|nr:hypothetical protein HDU76_005055 [Blyttiomyces sp. JEL0837]
MKPLLSSALVTLLISSILSSTFAIQINRSPPYVDLNSDFIKVPNAMVPPGFLLNKRQSPQTPTLPTEASACPWTFDGTTAITGNVCTRSVASGLPNIRAIRFDDAGRLLALVSIPYSQVWLLFPSTDPTLPSYEMNRILLLDAEDLKLTHSINLHNGYLYASSSNSVYRWPYTADLTFLDPTKAQVVVKDMDAYYGRSGHIARTLVFDPTTSDDILYVHIGSASNIDPTSDAARVVRFNLSNNIPTGGFDFIRDGYVWADGLRNGMALAFDTQGRLWEAENGPDDLSRDDLTGNHDPTIGNYHQDSPVEEINLLDGPKTHYGYPWCFTAGNVTGSFVGDGDLLRGKQFAWPKTMNDGVHDDKWCQDLKNNRPPFAHIPAHTAPIDMFFLKKEDGCGLGSFSVPCDVVGNLFITLHGSWNRDVPAGYSFIMIPIDPTTNAISQSKDAIQTILTTKDFIHGSCQQGPTTHLFKSSPNTKTQSHSKTMAELSASTSQRILVQDDSDYIVDGDGDEFVGKPLDPILRRAYPKVLARQMQGSRRRCFRPTGVTVNKNTGTVFISSDNSGEIIEVGFVGGN